MIKSLSLFRPYALCTATVCTFALSISAPTQAEKMAVMAVDSTFTTMDPYDANDSLSQAVAKSFYQGLFGFDKDMKIVNVLATSYKVSSDTKVYTIKLRQGVKFHDGSNFDAEAVKVNFDRGSDAKNKLKRYGLFQRIEKTEVIDPSTVKITLHEPFSAFINVLAHPSAAMISPTALKKWGRDIGLHPVGTGPFELVEWKQTDGLKVKKFANYWKAGYPKIDAIDWKPVIDNNTRAALIKTGEAHFAFRIPFEQASELKSNANIVLVDRPSIMERYVSLNTQHKPFDNLKVREALNYAIDKEALVKVAFSGFATPATGVAPQGIEYATTLGPWPYDPNKARALLKEAGYANGFESTLWAGISNSTSQKVIQFLQQQLAQVGVKVQIQALEAGERVSKVESAQDPATAPVRMYYIGWSASTGEADWAISPLLNSASFPPKLFNTAYYKNTKIDDALANALKTTDKKKKAALYASAQKQIWADAPWIFLVQEKFIYVHNKRLEGVYVMPDAMFSFDEIDLK